MDGNGREWNGLSKRRIHYASRKGLADYLVRAWAATLLVNWGQFAVTCEGSQSDLKFPIASSSSGRSYANFRNPRENFLILPAASFLSSLPRNRAMVVNT